jgi:glycerophosphoryl diester phosphodiesterase
VADKSLSELRGLDAGRGEPIPLLREVMDLIGPRAGLNVELKGPATAAPLLDLLAEYVAPPTVGKRRWTDERILVSSFQAGELERLKATRSQTRVGWLMSGASGLAFDRALERACRVRAHSIHVGLKFIRTAFVERAHARGLKLYVFTVNRARDIDRMLAMGVDGVFTDYPELVTGKAL